MNTKELAKLLNGREYRNEITKEEIKIARKNNLVVIFGFSDDNLNFHGAIDDEMGAWNGLTCYIDKKSKRIYNEVSWYIDENELSEDFEDIVQNYFDKECVKIEAKYNDFWEIKAEGTEYEKFEIFEDGEKFSDGLVIKI